MEIISLADRSFHSKKIANWYYDEWGDALSENTVDDIAIEIRNKVNLNRDIPHYYIAVDEEKLHGVVEIKIRENINFPEYVYWVGGLYVCADSRSKGIASKLIEFVKRRTNEMGIVELYLQCEQNLFSFYKYHSFKYLHDAKHKRYETKIMVYESSDNGRT